MSIATREYPDRYEITVADNGPGLGAPPRTPEPGKGHIGIENVRERLYRMSGGSLTYAPGEGGGTVAVISLPKQKQDSALTGLPKHRGGRRRQPC